VPEVESRTSRTDWPLPFCPGYASLPGMTLSDALNISDLREIARAKLPPMVFDYIDGGADDEVTLREATRRFDDYELVWKALVDIAKVDTATTIMGARSRLPFFITPVAGNRLFHPKQGELAVARAAESAGLIYSCSTMASQKVEDIAAAAPDTPKWVQVYVWNDRGLVEEFLNRAKAAGFTGCILTVDVPVAGNRERDPRNRFGMPPRMSPSLVRQVISRPGWLRDYLSGPKISAANFGNIGQDQGVMEFINSQFSRSVTWKDAEWMKGVWGEGFAIKGISRAEDAVACLDVGADAVWVSNHGGRQLDTSVPTIDLVSEIRDAIDGQADLIVDGGVRRGSHIVKLLARGATGVAVGKAWLYGLGAGGEAGVTRALGILEAEFVRTLQLMGVRSVAELDGSFIRPRA